MRNAWPMVQLGEILTERKEVPSADDLENGNVRIVSKIGFNDGKIILREDCQTKTDMILIRPGDLVVSGINAAKGAIAIYSEEISNPIAATIHYSSYMPNKEKVEIKYLWWLLRSHTFRDLLLKYVPGGIKTELKAKRLLPIPIPLPSLPEQKQILTRIERLSAKVEESKNLRNQVIIGNDTLIPSTIATILSGISIHGRLSDILLDKPRNGWSVRCDNIDSGVPILTLAAVTGHRYRETEFKRTSEPTSSNAYYWLKPGDLLITRSNTLELVGHAAIYNGFPNPCIYPDLMMRLNVNELRADKRFVHRWLSSLQIRRYIEQKAKGTSPTMKKISQKIVMHIPFPSQLPLTEQRRIVTYLDNLQAKIDALKHLQAETEAELDALLPSILDKAFRGEL